MQSHPVSLFVPVLLLVLPVPGAALRPALVEGLLLIGGGFKWALEHRSSHDSGKHNQDAAASALYTNSHMHQTTSRVSTIYPNDIHHSTTQQHGMPFHQNLSQPYDSVERPPYMNANASAATSATPFPGSHSDSFRDRVFVADSTSLRGGAPMSAAHHRDDRSYVDMDWPASSGSREPSPDSVEDFQQRPSSGGRLAHTDSRDYQNMNSVYQNLNKSQRMPSPPSQEGPAAFPHSSPHLGVSHLHDQQRAASPQPQQWRPAMPKVAAIAKPNEPAWAEPLFSVAPWMRNWGGFQ